MLQRVIHTFTNLNHNTQSSHVKLRPRIEVWLSHLTAKALLVHHRSNRELTVHPITSLLQAQLDI